MNDHSPTGSGAARADEVEGRAPSPAGAQVRARSRAEATRRALEGEFEELRGLLDQGQSSEVVRRVNAMMRAARGDASLLASARCLLAAALEMQGHYGESLDAVRMYEGAAEREGLDPEATLSIGVQLGLSYNYTGDHPKAIALLNGALREASETSAGARADARVGAIYLALARVYRSINEYTIARDHGGRALEHYRGTGDWRGLAEAYFAVGLAELFEGNYEPAQNHLEQALKLVGDRPASYLLGKIYTNLAGACVFLKRPHEGIGYLEKAISYYERTEHKANAVDGYNNLGVHLTLIGDWRRAKDALERALSLAAETDAKARVPMILDSLGELLLLRGEVEEAREHLERAVAQSGEQVNKWYSGQALRTLGRCHLALDETARALEEGERALSLAARIGDRQAICDSRLLMAEAHLRRGELDECEEELRLVADETTDSPADLAVTGEAQRLQGLLALARGDGAKASQHFGRSLSIYEMLGDRYRSAVARYELGRAYSESQPERASECLARASETFRELGARLDIERADEAAAALDRQQEPRRRQEFANFAQLALMRLTEAVASRELLLRELAAVVLQETGARSVLITEPDESGRPRVVYCEGWTPAECDVLTEEMSRAEADAGVGAVGRTHDAAFFELRPANARAVTVVAAPREAAVLPGGGSIEPMLRVVELGLDVCAFRGRARERAGGEEQKTHAREGFTPGFIHSSPAMTSLVEEIHKIRSSDVTVLITGESGTGKELVARAIHSLSSRRDKVFVPFNCTAVPKELSDAYLFGYRKGSFTGATNDSAGVIRAAAGGTIFLDEIGDLPLDIQPKLLRFLQEGEIQPLGEQRPVKVDVRVIAATNTDLERMVADGRFREDLYYRLNVIRLRVPPLRERRLEIPMIAQHYVKHFGEKFGRDGIRISPEAMDLLMVCDWPGNVRQLLNEIQRVVARAEGGATITPDHLSPELQHTSSPINTPGGSGVFSLASFDLPEDATIPEAVEELERRMIADALRKHGGNISRASRTLGITRRGLQLKLGRYAISARG
ncbi:MAG TPA: sigma 54-interacting transcriptional regulator [Pyrinomonadaceae bacterium]|nr:sigma 54-interacting transcriptional regulator [Pyrinomonadaceae bacterium]